MSESRLNEKGPRVDRLNYFLGTVGLGAAMAAAVTLLGPESSLVWVIGLVISFAGFVLEVLRLRNIGVSQWFAMLRFLPYLNVLYLIFLQSAQNGWADTRRLDGKGRRLFIFQLALLVLVIFMVWKLRAEIPYFL
jgi:uncharacterized membrane protein YhaH (DUF805 family)